MNKSVVSYDKDLPEIPERQAHTRPNAYLRKKEGSADEFEIVEERRPSRLLLIKKLRKAVDDWRDQGYPGASSVTERLFNFWFEEDHQVNNRLFRFYFGQREAVETLIYLYEIAQNRDAKNLINTFGEIFYPEGSQLIFGSGITHETAIDGRCIMRRYIPEVQSEQQQDLPAENLRRYAFKMATGSGKTVVMAMLMVWAYFHKRMMPNSDLSTNFLMLAPNVIVYQRLERDFASNRIFHKLPLIPSEWRSQWHLKVILRGESSEPDPTGNLFLTNIQQIYESREPNMTAENAVDVLLGRKPVQNLSSQGRSLLARLRGLKDLIALNDEAHHVHDEDLAWHRALTTIHKSLPKGLSLWLDFSATPKDQNGTYFPWIVCDYPLAQAVEDRIVKAPLIVHQVNRKEPENITRNNVIDAYREWFLAAIDRRKEHATTYKPFNQKPVLFIMAEQNVFADEIGNWLVESPDTGLKERDVLVIHTDRDGEVSKQDLEKAREAARDVDKASNPIKVIVSVLMLREGWDVNNVTIVLGLRPFTSKSRILPEQAVGRGLRLIEGIGPDRTQTLEVMGTQAFEEFVKELEMEGVGIKTVIIPPKPPVHIEPVIQKIDKDITIPLTHPVYVATYNDFEKAFGQFLQNCNDIVKFAALGTTEQESGTTFRVDYLKLSGAIGFYYPDWVAVQKNSQGEINWIIETKGRIWEDTEIKDVAITDWCQKISVQTGTQWRYLRVNQTTFEIGKFRDFQHLFNVINEMI